MQCGQIHCVYAISQNIVMSGIGGRVMSGIGVREPGKDCCAGYWYERVRKRLFGRVLLRESQKNNVLSCSGMREP